MVYLMRADFECNGIVATKVWILIFACFQWSVSTSLILFAPMRESIRAKGKNNLYLSFCNYKTRALSIEAIPSCAHRTKYQQVPVILFNPPRFSPTYLWACNSVLVWPLALLFISLGANSHKPATEGTLH